MHLTQDQSQRFFDLFYPLVVFANRKLKIADQPFQPWTDDADQNDVADICREIWHDTAIIDQFLSANPMKLSADQLKQIARWRYGIADSFILVRHDALHSILMANDRLFAISGISKELRQMVPKVPALVETVVLPFENRLVYSSNILSFDDMVVGKDMKIMINDEYQRLMDEGKLIITEDELIREHASYWDRWDQLAAQTAEDNAFSEAHMNDPVAGMHKGVLADLSPEEREAAISDYLRTKVFDLKAEAVKFLDSFTHAGAPTTSLKDCLALLTKNDLSQIASELDLEGRSKLRKAELVDAICQFIGDDPTIVARFLPLATPSIYDFLKNGSNTRVKTKSWGLEALEYADMQPLEPLSFLFFHQDQYTLVIPDEILSAFEEVAWEDIDEIRLTESRVQACLETYIGLNGILSVEDFVKAYRHHYVVVGAGPAVNEIASYVSSALADPYSPCRYWWFNEQLYLVSAELKPSLFSSSSSLLKTMESMTEDEWFNLDDEDQDAFICAQILHQQEGKPARYITEAELNGKDLIDFDLFTHTLAKPAVKALQDYLDAHVPDSQDDYLFADRIMEEIYFAAIKGSMAHQFIPFLQEEGISFDNVAQANECMQLISDACMSMPQWRNRGWAPNDIAPQGKTAPVSSKKVGRNDPCPCGSGKKYKKCCGR